MLIFIFWRKVFTSLHIWQLPGSHNLAICLTSRQFVNLINLAGAFILITGIKRNFRSFKYVEFLVNNCPLPEIYNFPKTVCVFDVLLFCVLLVILEYHPKKESQDNNKWPLFSGFMVFLVLRVPRSLCSACTVFHGIPRMGFNFWSAQLNPM